MSAGATRAKTYEIRENVVKKAAMIFALLALVTSPAALGQESATTAEEASVSTTEAPEATVTEGPKLLRTDKDRRSYSMGFNMGRRFLEDGIIVDPEVFGKGLAAGLSGGAGLLSEEKVMQILKAFQQEQMAKNQVKMARLAEDNTQAGKAFLAENATNVGVVTTESGLQYMIISEGKGPKPTPEDVVTVHYVGTLIDGREFDSSHKRGEPARLPVKGFIRGWAEALQMMTVGSKWKLFIPAELAYGPRGQGPSIEPNATLIFVLELLSIEDKTQSVTP